MAAFDVVVIGGGPGGYIAAIRAAQLGLSTACIDEWKGADGKPALGGTCTNVGCIPSKALLQSSENFEAAGHHFGDHGIKLKGIELDLATMLKRKDKIVKQNNDGIVYLFKKNKVTFFHGRGSFGSSFSEIFIDKKEKISAKHVIIATGSNPRALPGADFDEKLILSNAGALAIADVPKKLGVIGAGIIGLEMGSVWRRLGSDVTVLEALPTFLGLADETIAKEAAKIFVKQGLKIETGVAISKVSKGKGVAIEYKAADGSARKLEVDKLVVSIGRVPNTTGLNAEGIGLKMERGMIAVDDDCRTSVPGVWAIGDVVRGPMLAHKSEEEGAAVAERIAGHKPHIDFNTIPSVIYTTPEIAWVGQNEQQLKAAGVEYKVGSFPFSANGRARAIGDTGGMVKMLAHAKTDQILGVHIIGPYAGELIAEAVVAMEFRGASEDIAMICHAHPTLSEAMKEAALAVDKRALNI
jgi:dihydrolipoamide dehydrogenase